MAQNSSGHGTDKSSKKGFKIDFNLTEKQKNFFAVLFSVITLGVVITVFVLLFQGPGEEEEVVSSTTNRELQENLDRLNRLSDISPEDLFYEEVTFEDLDIYPSAWVERNFTPSERNNELLSGASGDPDRDGLINKLEFIYGSDPKNIDSLCNGESNEEFCAGLNDKENVDAGISPLTGLPLDEETRKFTINFQDRTVIESLEESFDNAAREGLDFPTLYQLSKTVDYTEQVETITVITEPETRQNLLDYTDFRITLVEDILGSNELQSLSRIYSLVSIDELTSQREALSLKLQEVENYQVPNTQAEGHKLYIFIFRQLLDLVDLRIDAIEKNTLDSEVYQQDARDTSISIVWSYRKLNENSLVVN